MYICMYNTFYELLFCLRLKYKVVQIWPGQFVCKQVTVCPGHIWTTLYMLLKIQGKLFYMIIIFYHSLSVRLFS
jgi:hypothetical protein